MTMNEQCELRRALFEYCEQSALDAGLQPEPVPRDIIESAFGGAQRAPSNCNTQPWFVHVVTGETLERLRAELPAKFAAGEIALDFLTMVNTRGSIRTASTRRRRHSTIHSVSRASRRPSATLGLCATSVFLMRPRWLFTLPTGFGLREAMIWACSRKP